jgi:hypothetical protein
MLAAGDHALRQRSQKLGEVDKDTEVRANQIVKITQLYGWMWLPVYYTWDCSLARIESGPYAGKEVAVGGEGMIYMHEVAIIGSVFLTNSASGH